jgi:hypothetical protein
LLLAESVVLVIVTLVEVNGSGTLVEIDGGVGRAPPPFSHVVTSMNRKNAR